MDAKKLTDLSKMIMNEKFSMNKGMSNSTNHHSFIERMKNILFNRLDEIDEALQFAVGAAKKIEVLEMELDDADRELTEKDEQIKELTAKATKTTSKKKTGTGLNG